MPDTPSDVMRRRGWTQHTNMDDFGRVCALGAYRAARAGVLSKIGEDWRLKAWATLVIETAVELYPDDPSLWQWEENFDRPWSPLRADTAISHVACFNDTEGRTGAQVLTVLEKVDADEMAL